MPERRDVQPIHDKLSDIRGRLLSDPSPEELQSMQLHLDTLEKLDRVSTMMMTSHDHDHMDDHDHTA